MRATTAPINATRAATLALATFMGGCSGGASVDESRTERAQHPETIYEAAGAGTFYAPFSLHLEPMERLILVNIEQDPDTVYVGFEPQVFDDPDTGSGMLVIAYRADGRVDVYHQSGLRMDGKDYGIVGKGLAHMAERPFEGAHFDIGPAGVDLSFAFDDIDGRPIEVSIREDGRRETKPFGLLAPLGYGTADPPYMPVFLLHDFYFVRRAGTEARVVIEGRNHSLDRLPVPLDGRRMLFTRYSPDLLLARWNTTHDGPLAAVPVHDGRAIQDDATFDLVDNAGRPEILRIRANAGQRQVNIDFHPAFPDFTGLRDGVAVEGRFIISGDPSIGTVSGEYRLARKGNEVEVNVHPGGGWSPNERRLVLRLMYSRVDAFKNWPKDYLWEARITLRGEDDPTMQARWRRISGPVPA
jgi:hypothetical protein